MTGPNLARIPIGADDLHALVKAREVLARLALTPEAGGLADVVGGSLATVLKLCYLDDRRGPEEPQGDSPGSPEIISTVGGSGAAGGWGGQVPPPMPGRPFMPSKPTLHQPKAVEQVDE